MEAAMAGVTHPRPLGLSRRRRRRLAAAAAGAVAGAAGATAGAAPAPASSPRAQAPAQAAATLRSSSSSIAAATARRPRPASTAAAARRPCSAAARAAAAAQQAAWARRARRAGGGAAATMKSTCLGTCCRCVRGAVLGMAACTQGGCGLRAVGPVAGGAAAAAALLPTHRQAAAHAGGCWAGPWRRPDPAAEGVPPRSSTQIRALRPAARAEGRGAVPRGAARERRRPQPGLLHAAWPAHRRLCAGGCTGCRRGY